MKRLIVSLTLFVFSSSSFAQGLSLEEKKINIQSIETLRATESDPANADALLNGVSTDVRELVTSLKNQGLHSTNYKQNEDGEYVLVKENTQFNTMGDYPWVTYPNHRCTKYFNARSCAPTKNYVCHFRLGWCNQ